MSFLNDIRSWGQFLCLSCEEFAEYIHHKKRGFKQCTPQYKNSVEVGHSVLLSRHFHKQTMKFRTVGQMSRQFNVLQGTVQEQLQR